MEILFYIIAGTISGIIAGMGMGGGTFLIPVLTIIFEFAQKTAQGINLLAFLPMAVVSLIIHFKNKLVNLKIGIPIVITGAITSFLNGIILSVTDFVIICEHPIPTHLEIANLLFPFTNGTFLYLK